MWEKQSQPGGLAAGHQRGGNWYDLGVHMLHAFDEEVFATCARAMGEERIEVPLKSHIKWHGKLYHYPLRGRDILAGIPPFTLIRCLTGLLLAEIESRWGRRTPGPDAESALCELYGPALYEFFFEEFTHRYWGIHPRDLSAEFVRRKMPRLSAVDVFKNLLEKLRLTAPRDSSEGALRFETLHYSPTGLSAYLANWRNPSSNAVPKSIWTRPSRPFTTKVAGLLALMTCRLPRTKTRHSSPPFRCHA